MIGSVEPVSFDQLFNQTEYQQTLTLCMHIWDDLRQAEVVQLSSIQERDYHDLLLGRLMRMKCAIKKLATNKATIDGDNLSYLCAVLQHIEDEQHDYLMHIPHALALLEKSEHYLAHTIPVQ